MNGCKLKKLSFLAVFIVGFLSLNLSAQSADQIINQNLENSGGVKNWRNLNSIILRGDALLSIEQSFPIIIYHKRPYQKKVVFIVEGKELLNEGYDGKKGWTFNDISGKNEVVKGYQPDSFESDILDYQKKGFTAEYTGKSKSDNQECNTVVLTKNVNKTTYCFSTHDASLLWEENTEEKVFYYDYKVFNGLRFATRMVGQPKAGGEYVIKFNSIQINPVIEDKVFKF
jgi:outer membrane lipoprotein-sorting protein